MSQFNYTDIAFFFYFEAENPITWEQIDSDAEFNVFATVPAIDHDTSFNVQAAEQIDSDTKFNIFATIPAIDHDTSFNIQAISLSDTSYLIFSTVTELDHDTSFNIQGAGLSIDHATLYRIRIDDEITN